MGASSRSDDKAFQVEDESRAHVKKLNDLMTSNYDWCSIQLVTYLSQAADFLGQWGEACPCAHHNALPRTAQKRSGQQLRTSKLQRQQDGSTCAFRCCRAAELANGNAMALLNDFMASQQSKFLKCVAAAPTSHQSELTGAWYTASSKLIGNLLVYSSF